jgi:hypothetical protein
MVKVAGFEVVMARALLAPLVVMLACSSGGDKKPSGDEVAGKVLEVVGEVTARRAQAASARALSKGATLFADDTVVTAAASSVRIHLVHNDAVFDLAANKSVRLDRSVAWKAPRGTSPGLLDQPVDDHTAIAGRHGERAAADTEATAVVIPPPDRPSNDGYTKGVAGDKSPDPTGAIELSYRLAGNYAIKSYAVTSANVAYPDDTVKQAITAALDVQLPGCYAAVLDAAADVGGDIVVTIDITAAGKVTVKASGFSPILVGCVQGSISKLTLTPGVDDSAAPVATQLRIELVFTP